MPATGRARWVTTPAAVGAPAVVSRVVKVYLDNQTNLAHTFSSNPAVSETFEFDVVHGQAVWVETVDSDEAGNSTTTTQTFTASDTTPPPAPPEGTYVVTFS